MILTIPLIRAHVSTVFEHIGFWALPADGNASNYASNMLYTQVQFVFEDQIIIEGKIACIEPVGFCQNPKFEYFRNFIKVWFTPIDVVDELNTIGDGGNWDNIPPLARINSRPNSPFTVLTVPRTESERLLMKAITWLSVYNPNVSYESILEAIKNNGQFHSEIARL